MKYALLASLAGLLLAACASSPRSDAPSPSGDQGEPLRLTYHQAKDDRVLELVNETHTDPVEYYSQERSSNARKIQNDEIMAELLGYMSKNGFDRWSLAGAAARPGAGVAWTLEVETPRGVSHVAWRSGASRSELEDLKAIKEAFVAIYANTGSAQSVRLKPGENPFETPDPQRSNRN